MRNQLQVKVWKSSALPTDWFKRTRTLDESIENDVKAIVNKVVKNGDAALIEFAEKFDKATLEAENLRVTAKEIEEAYKATSKEQISALKLMKSKVGSLENRVLERIKIATSKDGIAVQTAMPSLKVAILIRSKTRFSRRPPDRS